MIKEISAENYLGIEIQEHELFDHEHLFVFEDDDKNFKAFIAIHSTKEGPAIGGCRFKEYESEIHAIEDVLKLSKAMTLKNRVAGVPFGGGKAVIIKNKQNNKEHLELFATFINHLDGAYLSAQDIGISLTDIRIVSQLSEHVLDNVDPGPYTAKGIYYALRSVKDYYFNGNNEDILIQGFGSVGSNLASHLLDDGTKIYVDEADEMKLNTAVKLGCNPCKSIFKTSSSIFSPCAIGGILNKEFIKNSTFKVICGGANNQLLSDNLCNAIHSHGMLYIPDFLVNAGGVIGLTKDVLERNDEMTDQALAKIGEVVKSIIDEFHIKNTIPLEFVKNTFL